MFEVYDPLYKTNIQMTGIIERIVQTPQFQRLKYIKQLGFAFIAHPNCTHSRYEHSIGVYYLSKQWLGILIKKGVEISESDALCVQIAALCHDLGHGPFSHECDLTLFPNLSADVWISHENQSVRMLEFLLQENNIQLSKYGLQPTRDLLTIQEMILGTAPTIERERNKMGEHTLWPRRRFLYDIVNNIHSGLDVDKMDYLRRDLYYLQMYDSIPEAKGLTKSPIDIIFKHSRVSIAKDTSDVLYSIPPHASVLTFDASKCFDYIQNLFRTRMELHRRVYRNPQSKAHALSVHELIKDVNMNMCFKDLNEFTTFTDKTIDHVINGRGVKRKRLKIVESETDSDKSEVVYIHCGAYNRKPTELVHWNHLTPSQADQSYICEHTYNLYYKYK